MLAFLDLDNAGHWSAELLHQKLLGTFSDFAEYAAFFSEEHTDLDFVADIEVEVNTQRAVEFGHPPRDVDTDLVRNLLEIPFHYGLPHCFLRFFDFALGASDGRMVTPFSHLSLVSDQLPKRVDTEPTDAADVKDFLEVT